MIDLAFVPLGASSKSLVIDPLAAYNDFALLVIKLAFVDSLVDVAPRQLAQTLPESRFFLQFLKSIIAVKQTVSNQQCLSMGSGDKPRSKVKLLRNDVLDFIQGSALFNVKLPEPLSALIQSFVVFWWPSHGIRL